MFHCLLGDFGAATQYRNLQSDIQQALEQLEVRAFACLLEDLLTRLDESEAEQHACIVEKLQALQRRCFSIECHNRPLFTAIYNHIFKLKV
ncbi:MAG: hypothetical protein R8K50_05995 [Mariprofundus sp.]